MSARPLFDDSYPWPFKVAELVRFTLQDTFTQQWATSAANNFFRAVRPSEESQPFVDVRREVQGWAFMPKDWQEYFETTVQLEERDQVLEDLANGSRQDFPPSLTVYLDSCRSLSLDRTCTPTPVLSFPSPAAPPDAPKRPWPTAQPHQPLVTGQNTKNALQAGQSPKKEHEVKQLSALVKDLLDEAPLSHCVDVGSGRAHLSRALASPPLDLQVLAIDWSDSQKSGAEKLDEIRDKAQLAPVKGSLTHEVSSLDADGVTSVLARWPPPEFRPTTPPALLVALHACGDLTPDALKAFIRSNADEGARRAGARAVCVGCCYNMQTPSLFPLSSFVKSLPLAIPPAMTRAHLRLTPQSPPTWHVDAASSAAWRASTLKIAYRARFEAEMEGAQLGADDERRVGRIPECKTWEEYRQRAIKKYDYGRTKITPEDVPPLRFGAADGSQQEEDARWETALFLLRVFWTIRCWLGPPLESLCVLDRFTFLCEGLRQEWEDEREGPRRRVEVVNVFEQKTGSLRNLALVVR
ncbi:hypothetical protein JCM10207_000495 [Rhodosporidiobolus poonsookiae]